MLSAFFVFIKDYNLLSSYINSYLCFHLKKFTMGNLGFQEILLIAVVVLVLFGGRKIPEFMKGLGRGVREFNDAKNNVRKELEEGLNEKVETPPITPTQQSAATTTTTTTQP